MAHPTRPPQHPRPPSSPMEALEAVGANAGAASGAAEVLPSSNPPPPPPHPQPHPLSYPHLHPRPHPPPPIISISPPSTPGSPLHSPIDIAGANFERFHATRSPHPTSAPDTSPTTNPPDRRASLYDNNEKNFRSSLESDLDLDLELDLGLDYIDDDDCDILTNMAGYSGQARIRGSSETVQMVLLTFVMIGITFTWGIEMTYCTPYLLNLGLTKSNTALVWIAGPLSGICVQPVIGVISDESKSKWGRRRPIMVASAVLSAICMLVLGFTREVVGLVIQDDESAKKPTIVLAVLSIYAVDFAINAVMSTSRSLIVDTLPIEKQQLGAAWSSRMSAIGHVIGYGAGALDLAAIFGTALGDTQFKQLTVIASLTILGTTALTSWAVSERVLMSSGPSKHQGILKPFRQIWATLSQLPPRIQAICWVQFWSWIGWFPFLFYSTTWIGETYFRYDISPEDRASADALGEIGRIGSTSLVIYSTITFIGAWLLPMVVQAPSDNSYTRRPPKALEGFLERFDKLKPDLLTVWVYGHLLFFVAMAMAPFATSYRFATFLVCLCGIPWTIAGWAPTTFLGIEVNKLSGASERGSYRQVGDNIELNDRTSNEIPTRLENGFEAASGPSSNGELSGIYFGILNIYTTIPQFIGTFISTIVFSILEPGQSPELASDSPKKVDEGGPNAIAVCLFIGAMSTFVASFVTRRLRHL